MELNIVAVTKLGPIRSARTTAANLHDRQALREATPDANDFANVRAQSNAPLSDAQKAKNRSKSAVRDGVEHTFLQAKRLLGYADICCRGLPQNANGLVAMHVLYNVRRAGIILGDRCVRFRRKSSGRDQKPRLKHWFRHISVTFRLNKCRQSSHYDWRA